MSLTDAQIDACAGCPTAGQLIRQGLVPCEVDPKTGGLSRTGDPAHAPAAFYDQRQGFRVAPHLPGVRDGILRAYQGRDSLAMSNTAEEAFLSGRISAHEFPARRLETRDGRVHFARPFGINPHGIWDDSRLSGLDQEYEAWNEEYEAETTLCYLMGGGKIHIEGRH